MMIVLIRRTLLATLIGCLSLTACSQKDPASSGADSSDAKTSAVPTDDPCKLLTDAEVRHTFAQAVSGKRDHSLDKNGILTCVWDTPTDRFVVQTYAASSGSVEDELRGRVVGSIDPLMSGAAENVRYEKIAGVGDGAMLVVEKADAARGILADTAVLVTRRGERIAVLFTGSSLADDDRAAALMALETLGRSAAMRLLP